MKYNRLLLPALLLLSLDLFSQTILLRSGTMQPEENIRKEVLDSFNATAPRVAGQAFAVIQFNAIPSIAERKLLAANGVELLEYLPDNAYTVSIKGAVTTSVLQQAKARSLFQLSARQKMQDYFVKGILPAWAVKVEGTVDVWISFPKTVPVEVVVAQLKSLNVELLSDQYKTYRILSLRIAANRITEIASLPFVDYIQAAPPANQPLNHNSRVVARANMLNASVADGGRGLNGEGVVVGVGDNADLQYHVDFNGRLINRNPQGFNAHGVHVAGTVGGAGNINELFRGYAPKATILNQSFNGIVDNAPAYVQDYGMVITNNSYGNIIACDYHGTYDLYSRMMDQQAFDLPNLLNIFSAGNSGGDVCAPYPSGYRTVIGGYQTAKNVITVGATDDSGAIAGFSSRGPVKDGRLKPEISAMGSGVYSAWPTNIYSINFGTSMSSPGVSGGLALLYQRYRQLHAGANPRNGLMKAILCNGAADRGNSGPDFQNGFGCMNLLRSIETLENTQYFMGNSTQSSTLTHTVTVPANTAQLKVLLYYNDVPASVISTKNLVNDLDLEVLTPSAAIVLPQILDTTIAALNNTAVSGADHLNNIEQIIINNPVAGSYTVRIKGTAVTNALQEYFVVYDAPAVGVKLTSPAGGEALVPGENAKISWDASGLTGTANLEFSSNGGATWSAVAGGTNVDVNRGVFTWAVPAVATSNALVRVTKNGTGETSASGAFTIIGQPALSLAAVQCEGYIGLNWTAVSGATDYDVLLLRGDDMKVVATTAATTYNFSGLSKDSVYWVTARARVNGKAGRRAYAVSRQPNSGSCAGTISDNDLKLEAILGPVTSGRLYTSTQLTAAQTVSVRIKNLDDAPVNSFAVSYAINGATVTENVSTPIAAGGTYDHVFTTTANLSAVGAYTLVASVRHTPDVVTANDSMVWVIKQIDNQPLNLTTAFADDIEAAAPAEYKKDTIGFTGLERYDFNSTTAFGRARTFVNSGIAYSGARAITLDATRFWGAGNTSYLIGTYNLSNYTTAANDLRLDFQYLNHGQFANADNRVWIRGSELQPWIEVYKLDSAQQDAGEYRKTKSIELTRFLAANGQSFTPGFGVRWGQWGQYQAADKSAAAGYTFDDIRLYQVFNDVQLIRIDTPAVNSCGLSAATPVKVSVRNSSNTTVTNVPVYYRVNAGPLVSEIIPSIAAGATIQYTFTATANFSQLGANTIQTYVAYVPDSYKENDTAAATVYNTQIISSFPYLQNFEAGDGAFYAGGKKSSWEYGTPTSRKVKSAASGANAWKTRLSGSYNDYEASYLYSPCFDVTGLTAPTLSFSVALDIEDCGGSLCDGAWVEYSADGITWIKLGTAGTGTNWYNKTADQLWSIQNYTTWHVATQALPTGLSRLRLRFVLVSDPGVSREGVAIDDIHIYDNTKGIYDGVTMAGPITQAASGTTWVDYTSGSKLVASIQPAGANLGSTDVQAFIHTGTVRNNNNQYYHNRNITIKPANNTLPDSVWVRFYFTDTETNALLAANDCGGCNRVESAYTLGVAKYTDADKSKENGTIADNTGGNWLFIPPAGATKVPFDKGYYAEFKAAGFSEFWLSAGGLNNLTPLPVKLVDFTAIKQATDVAVAWKVTAETGVSRYEVEVAKGNASLNTNSFIKIGEIVSTGAATMVTQYAFTDTEGGKLGARYYRLKIINTNGSFSYSEVRAVLFGDAVVVQLYPNPSRGEFNLTYQAGTGETIVATVYSTNGSLVKEYRSVATGFLQKLNIDLSANNYASGVYFLKLTTGGLQQTFKLYRQ